MTREFSLEWQKLSHGELNIDTEDNSAKTTTKTVREMVLSTSSGDKANWALMLFQNLPVTHQTHDFPQIYQEVCIKLFTK